MRSLPHSPHTRSGPLFYRSIFQQFLRLRDGDRFFYFNLNTSIPATELSVLATTTLSQLIKRNTPIVDLPARVFVYTTPAQKCLASAAAACSAGTGTGSSGSGSGVTNSLKYGTNSEHTLTWSIDSASATITITLAVVGSGWVGFGLGSSMLNADIGRCCLVACAVLCCGVCCALLTLSLLSSRDVTQVIGRILNGQAVLNDCSSRAYGLPIADTTLGGTNDVTLLSGSSANGIVTISFRRALAVASDTQFDKPIAAGTTSVMLAWGPSPNLGYHGASNRQVWQVNFFDAAAAAVSDGEVYWFSAKPTVYVTHGVLMGAVWALAVPLSVVLVRYVMSCHLTSWLVLCASLY